MTTGFVAVDPLANEIQPDRNLINSYYTYVNSQLNEII